ncbi:MAG TPA: acetolactate decarboxylase [Solirubrobacteraceae bacterium]|nr:acetolactate decarboxylase [Solirubrobacteraceae bacterium]
MSELEFLGALHVELLRHAELTAAHPEHELFQTSTVQALLAGDYDGDVTLAEILEHGDLGLGTLNGLDGELIVLDGEVWKARLDCTLERPEPSARTPYAVVVPFSPERPLSLRGPFGESELEAHLGEHVTKAERPTAVRIDGRFAEVHVRSVPRQARPYRPLAEVIEQQQVSALGEVSGTMMGFCFPDALDGIEMVGAHLHFIDETRTRGGHVLSYTLLEATAWLDGATRLHVELPEAVATPRHGAALDQAALHRLESDR